VLEAVGRDQSTGFKSGEFGSHIRGGMNSDVSLFSDSTVGRELDVFLLRQYFYITVVIFFAKITTIG